MKKLGAIMVMSVCALFNTVHAQDTGPEVSIKAAQPPVGFEEGLVAKQLAPSLIQMEASISSAKSPALNRALSELRDLKSYLDQENKEQLVLDSLTHRLLLKDQDTRLQTEKVLSFQQITLQALGEGKAGPEDWLDIFPPSLSSYEQDALMIRDNGIQMIRVEGFVRDAALLSIAGLTRSQCLWAARILTGDQPVPKGWRLLRIEFGPKALERPSFAWANSSLAAPLGDFFKWQIAKLQEEGLYKSVKSETIANRALEILDQKSFDPCGSMRQEDTLKTLWVRTESLKERTSVARLYKPLPELSTSIVAPPK